MRSRRSPRNESAVGTVVCTSIARALRRRYALAMLFAVTACGDQLTASAPNVQPARGPRAIYAGPDGILGADGSIGKPLNLALALGSPGLLLPGDTLYLLGGTYRGDFVSRVRGDASLPVVVRNAPGARAIIDGSLTIRGASAWYWGLEIYFSDLQRESQQPVSAPTDIPRATKTVAVEAADVRLINLVLHDLGNTLFAGILAPNLEISGTLAYNNGWMAQNRGHGHGFYLQNQSGRQKRVLDNVLFHQFSTGIKVSGSASAYLESVLVEGNTSFNNGAPTAAVHGASENAFHQGGTGRSRDLIFRGNSFFHTSGLAPNFKVNSGGTVPGQDLTFADNITQGAMFFGPWRRYAVTGNKFSAGDKDLLVGQSLLQLVMDPAVPYSDHTWDRNTYAVSPPVRGPFYSSAPRPLGSEYPMWRQTTGYDAASTFVAGRFTGADVIVRPNRYERGRAFVTVWNWDRSASVPVDLSSVLQSGDQYQIHHVYDIFGPPLATGTYSGAPITLSQRAPAPPLPIGWTQLTGVAGLEFNVFLVRLMP